MGPDVELILQKLSQKATVAQLTGSPRSCLETAENKLVSIFSAYLKFPVYMKYLGVKIHI